MSDTFIKSHGYSILHCDPVRCNYGDDHDSPKDCNKSVTHIVVYQYKDSSAAGIHAVYYNDHCPSDADLDSDFMLSQT